MATFIGKEVKNFIASVEFKQKPSTCQEYRYCSFTASLTIPECKGCIESTSFFFFFLFSWGIWVGKAITTDEEGKFISLVAVALGFLLDLVLELSAWAFPR